MRQRVLITRPHPRAQDTAQAIELALPGRFEPVIAPLLEVTEEPAELDLEGVQALLFTSQNAVEMACNRWALTHLPTLCVGDATTRAAQAAGFAAQSAAGDTSTLATLAAEAFLQGAGDYLHLRGVHGAGDLAGALAAEGIGLREVIIYDQRPLDLPEDVLDYIAADGIAAILVYSPRTGALLGEALMDMPLPHDLSIIVISQSVASSLPDTLSHHIRVAERPDQPAMLACLADL